MKRKTNNAIVLIFYFLLIGYEMLVSFLLIGFNWLFLCAISIGNVTWNLLRRNQNKLLSFITKLIIKGSLLTQSTHLPDANFTISIIMFLIVWITYARNFELPNILIGLKITQIFLKINLRTSYIHRHNYVVTAVKKVNRWNEVSTRGLPTSFSS